MDQYQDPSVSTAMLNENKQTNKQKQETNKQTKQTTTFKSMYFLQGSTYSSVQSSFNF